MTPAPAHSFQNPPPAPPNPPSVPPKPGPPSEGVPTSPASTRARIESATPVGSPGSARRPSDSRSTRSMSRMVVLPAEPGRERGTGPVELGLDGPGAHPEAFGDLRDRLVEQV